MAQTKYYNTGGGSLEFTPIVNGVLGAKEDFGQTENITFNVTTETITHDNTETCTSYEDMNILKKVTGKLAIETLEISPEMLQRAYLGSLTRANNPSGTAILANVTIVALGEAYFVGSKYISNVIVKDDSDTTTYTLGVDYTLDEDKGMISAVAGGAILVNDIIHVTYDNASYDDVTIQGFTETKLEGVLTFTSCAGSGMSYVYTFHRVSLLASGDYSLKSADEFVKLAFEGTMLASELVTGAGVSKLFKIEGSEKV